MGGAGGAEEKWPLEALTAPSTASAVSGADNDTSQRCAPASDPQAVKGQKILSACWGTQMKVCLARVELRTEIRGVVGEAGPLAVAV